MSPSTIEDRLRSDLHRVAETIISHPSPFVTAPVARRRRRRRIGLVCVAGLALAGAGTAVALRLIPDDVQRTNEQITQIGSCGTALTADATMVASAPRADGKQLQLWITPTSTGNETANLRTVLPDGAYSGTTATCGLDDIHDWVNGGTEIADGQTIGVIDIAGRTASGAKSVRITFASGASAVAAVQTDGYFIVSLRDDITRYQSSPQVEPVDAATDATSPG